MGRREGGIVATRKNLHRQVRYPVFPTAKIIGTSVEIASVTTSVPHPVLGNDEGSRSIVTKLIRLPPSIQVPGLHRQLSLPTFADFREVM